MLIRLLKRLVLIAALTSDGAVLHFRISLTIPLSNGFGLAI